MAHVEHTRGEDPTAGTPPVTIPPAVAPQGLSAVRARDRIVLTGISATGHHGVLAHERAEGQLFRADVAMTLDTRAAAATDRLDLSADYGAVAKRVHDVMAGEPADLLETVAERIAEVCLTGPVEAVEVTVHKPQAPIPVPFDDVAVSIRRVRADAPSGATVPAVLDAPPAAPVPAVIALGGNVGDVAAVLRGAVTALSAHPGIDIQAISPLARTRAVGGIEQPDFLNAVVTVHTTVSPRRLLQLCLHLERQANRRRTVRWGPRTLDLDVISYADLVVDGPGLCLPHPRAHQRAFVLAPWAAVEPDAVLGGPEGGAVAQLAGAAPDAGGLSWVASQWPWPEAGGPQ